MSQPIVYNWDNPPLFPTTPQGTPTIQNRPTQTTQTNFQAFLNSLPTIIGTLRPQQQGIAPGTTPPTTTPTKDNTIWYVLGGAGLLIGAFYLMRKK